MAAFAQVVDNGAALSSHHTGAEGRVTINDVQNFQDTARNGAIVQRGGKPYAYNYRRGSSLS